MRSKGPRFELVINGDIRHIIGIPKRGILSVDIDIFHRRMRTENTAQQTDQDGWLQEVIEVSWRGSDSNSNKSLRWPERRLYEGDEVHLCVLPPGTFDKAPTTNTRKKIVVPEPPGGRWPPPTLPMLTYYGPVEQSRGCRLQLFINGEHKSTLGLIGSGSFGINMFWVRRSKKLVKSWSENADSKWLPIKREEMVLQMGGLDVDTPAATFFESHKQLLSVGDEIWVKVLPPGEIGQCFGHTEIPFRRDEILPG
jgi:hypothetical protein